jgi:hypothetical protein
MTRLPTNSARRRASEGLIKHTTSKQQKKQKPKQQSSRRRAGLRMERLPHSPHPTRLLAKLAPNLMRRGFRWGLFSGSPRARARTK